MRVDPLAEEMPVWSLYSYVFNNPLIFIDPTGAVPEDNIGVDKDGNVVFEDEHKDDGNLFLVNEGTGKISSLEQLKVNSTQLAKDGRWIGTDEQLISYVRSQGKHVENPGKASMSTINLNVKQLEVSKGDNVETITSYQKGNVTIQQS